MKNFPYDTYILERVKIGKLLLKENPLRKKNLHNEGFPSYTPHSGKFLEKSKVKVSIVAPG